jgi:hypothetical protein
LRLTIVSCSEKTNSVCFIYIEEKHKDMSV